METYNICLSKEVDKKYNGCDLMPTELLDCGLIVVCVVIRLNMVDGKRDFQADARCEG